MTRLRFVSALQPRRPKNVALASELCQIARGKHYTGGVGLGGGGAGKVKRLRESESGHMGDSAQCSPVSWRGTGGSALFPLKHGSSCRSESAEQWGRGSSGAEVSRAAHLGRGGAAGREGHGRKAVVSHHASPYRLDNHDKRCTLPYISTSYSGVLDILDFFFFVYTCKQFNFYVRQLICI